VSGGPPLRLATVNLQHGLGSDGARAEPGHWAAALASLGADLLALQELDHRQPRSGRLDQATVVADATGLRWFRFAAALEGDVRAGKARARTTDRTAPRHAGVPGYGVAIFSRYPVLAWFAQPLPEVPVRALRTADEPRVCLAAVVRTPAGLLCVASTHLSRQSFVASRQLRTVNARLRVLARRVGPEPGAPVASVLLGDLNMTPGRAARSGMVALATALTHPAARPVRQVDHILGSGGVRALAGGRAVKLGVSDHLALTVDVRLEPGPDR
jgi:endonuclease/exonuclease/phosphatase family metal-dependent hydrolase